MPGDILDASALAAAIASFVDPGPAFDPCAGPDDAFFRAVIEQAAEMVVAFSHDGVITYVNDASRPMLGREPSELVGTSVLDLVAPDDLENAAQTIHYAAGVEGWRPARPFRLVHADGRLISFEVSGTSLFHDERAQSIVVVARWADAANRVDRVLALLAAHRPASEVLAELVHLLDRPGWLLTVALQYDDGTGQITAASSGGDAALTGLASLDAGPWATARETGQPVIDIGLHHVPAAVRAQAEAAGYVTCWAVPVPDPGGHPACLVVWNGEAVEPELGQDVLLQRLLSLVEVALRGRAHATALDRAAHCDPLTGLWNRRYLEAAARRESASTLGGHMAVAICDLDGFKQVNDQLGHPAGDLVIRTVAERLTAAVRETDVVARFGGDEFAILCPGVTGIHDIEALAERIVEAVQRPIDHEAGPIRVGVSVGAAMAVLGDGWDLDQLVRRADAELLAAKAAGKATFRITVLDAA